MSFYNFCFSLYRANPAVYRVLSFPDTFTFGELTDLLAISVGIPSAHGSFYTESGDAVSGEQSVSELMEPGDSGKVLLYNGDDAAGPLIFFADFMTDVTEKDGKLPYVAEAFGGQIPEDLTDMSVINRVHMGYEHMVTYHSRVFSGELLKFSAKRTENEIRRRFAPDTVVKMVNMELGLPMDILFENLRVNEIKEILRQLDEWYDSQDRKSDLIYELCAHWKRKDAYKFIFSNMSLTELENFKEIVTEDRMPAAAMNFLPLVADCGLIVQTKAGPFFSRDFLSYYESRLDIEGEKAILDDANLRTAFQLSSDLYGIFSFTMFYDLLSVLNGNEITKEEAEKFLCQNKALGNSKPYGFYYNREEFSESEAVFFWKRTLHNPEALYLPDRKELLKLSTDLYSISDKNAQELHNLNVCLLSHGYYYRSDMSDDLKKIRYCLHKGASRPEMIKMLNSDVFRYWEQWGTHLDARQNRFLDIWMEEAENFPQVLLGGFSRKNCPKEVMNHYQEILQAEAEKEKEKIAAKKGGRR